MVPVLQPLLENDGMGNGGLAGPTVTIKACHFVTQLPNPTS